MSRRPLVLSPSTTAVITMELQRGVVGDLSSLAELAAAATAILPGVAQVCAAARAAGGHVVHATMAIRPGGEGFTTNSPIQAASLRSNADLLTVGSPGVELVPELEVQPTDVISARHTGMTPFTGTDLHDTLQSLGVDTVVATGVSLNIGILGMVLSAADLGYRVVVPTDAVVGLPADYGDAVLANTIGLLATLSTVGDVVAALKAGHPDR
jgi:nicotinamidase-related amidase